tara:strand:- start:539 stop:712 length:174 start_codon:yes stop_codon:yes gene_type:complete
MIWTENKLNKLNFVKTVLADLIKEVHIKKDAARWDMIYHTIKAVEEVEMELKKEGVI